MKIFLSLLLVITLVHQSDARTCPSVPQPVPAPVTWPPVKAAYPGSYGGGQYCDFGLECYHDGSLNQCYDTEGQKYCRALPSNVTWPPVKALSSWIEYYDEQAQCGSGFNCYWNGAENQCYPNRTYDQCPPLPSTFTWAPSTSAYFNVQTLEYSCTEYDYVYGGNLQCYNDGTKNQCYMSEEAMADCPPVPSSVTWLPYNEPYHNWDSGADGRLQCYNGYACYNDGTANKCYQIEGECISKPENVTVPPTGRAVAGRCPEDYACYFVNGVNQCYCHDNSPTTECQKYYHGTFVNVQCNHKRNQCARTCGWCI